MASQISYGARIADRDVRTSLQTASEEITALSGHVAAFQATLTVAGTDVTTVATTVNQLLAKLVAAGLMAAS